jgi:hypothetical protein
MRHELVIPANPSTLPALEAGTNLTGWLLAYCHTKVATQARHMVHAALLRNSEQSLPRHREEAAQQPAAAMIEHRL